MFALLRVYGAMVTRRVRAMGIRDKPIACGSPWQGDPLWRALAAASAERICRTFPCRAESPREGQCPTVPSECKHPPRRAYSMPRATGRPVALLLSGGSVTACSGKEDNNRKKKKEKKWIKEGRAEANKQVETAGGN